MGTETRHYTGRLWKTEVLICAEVLGAASNSYFLIFVFLLHIFFILEWTETDFMFHALTFLRRGLTWWGVCSFKDVLHLRLTLCGHVQDVISYWSVWRRAFIWMPFPWTWHISCCLIDTTWQVLSSRAPTVWSLSPSKSGHYIKSTWPWVNLTRLTIPSRRLA